MNRGKKPLTAKERKKQKKETQVPLQPSEPKEVSGTWKILSKFPELATTKKKIETKKKKLHSKHSKRTTPGEVEADITPYAHVHPEGKKVIQSREKQTVAKANRLNKKLSKVKK